MADSYLVQRRKARGVTQSELARKSRVDQGKLSEMESGKRALSLPDARKLAPNLAVKSSELFARQIGARAAVKSEQGRKGPIHRAIADVEELLDDASGDDEKEALRATISELENLLGDQAPDDADTATKSQSRVARKGRDTLGRRRRNADTVTKSAGEPRRDHLGRSNRRPGDQSG